MLSQPKCSTHQKRIALEKAKARDLRSPCNRPTTRSVDQSVRESLNKGLIEMQVACSTDTMDLIFNDRHFYGLMKKATPYKVINH